MSVQKTRQLAIIREVQCGMGDRGSAVLSFATFIDEGSSALQVLRWEDAKNVIEAYGVEHVEHLNGKPCWVQVGEGRIIFDGAAKIGGRS